MESPTLILFDFDGTLVDSIPVVQAATNAVLKRYGFAGDLDPLQTIEGMPHQTKERFGFHSGVDDDDVLERMRRDFYEEHARISDSIVLHPAMSALIDRIQARGWKTGIVSNNSSDRIRDMLGMDAACFDVIIGEFDVSEAKPDPEGIEAAIATVSGERLATALVGDASPDAESARRAGVFSIGITWIHERYGIDLPTGFPRLVGGADELEETLVRWHDLVAGVPEVSTGDTPGRPPTQRRTLLFMRHCQSEANRVNVMASRKDFSLSEKGAHDAAYIAEQFLAMNRFSVDRIFASPLLRAQQTARPFSEATGIPVTVREGLVEHELGEFSGLTFEEAAVNPDYCHDKTARWNWKPRGGETYQEIYERLIPLFLEFGSDGMNGTTLCVSHAVTMRIIQTLLENTAPHYPVPYPGNGEIWVVEFQGIGICHEIERLHIRTDDNPP